MQKTRQSRLLSVIMALTTIFFLGRNAVQACSTIMFKKGNELLYGHNLNNNGSDIPGLVFINQRGVFKTGRTWDEIIYKDRRNPSRFSWISRYGSVSFNTFAKDFPDGGMNEAGIYVWEMGLSHSEIVYPKDPSLPKLNQMHWMQYILDTAASLDEALACAREFEIDGWGWHFFLGDGEGNCAVIDFVDGRVVVHRGEQMPVPGLFNARYAREISQSRFFKGFGGQYEPVLTDKLVPRYVKTGVMLKQYDGREDALEYSYKILDHLFVSEVADWSVVFDVRGRRVHFKTSRNRSIKQFSLDGLDFSNAGPVQILAIDIAEGGDVGEQFQAYSHEKMADFIRTIPLPREFCEMGGLTSDEFITRLARHTVHAEEAGQQPFLGTWQVKAEKEGDAPRWLLRLWSQGAAIRGEITNGQGFVNRGEIEQIGLKGTEFSFSFRGQKDRSFVFADGTLQERRMILTFMGLEAEYGSFEFSALP